MLEIQILSIYLHPNSAAGLALLNLQPHYAANKIGQ